VVAVVCAVVVDVGSGATSLLLSIRVIADVHEVQTIAAVVVLVMARAAAVEEVDVEL